MFAGSSYKVASLYVFFDSNIIYLIFIFRLSVCVCVRVYYNYRLLCDDAMMSIRT